MQANTGMQQTALRAAADRDVNKVLLAFSKAIFWEAMILIFDVDISMIISYEI